MVLIQIIIGIGGTYSDGGNIWVKTSVATAINLILISQ
jgi:hypothetical protein